MRDTSRFVAIDRDMAALNAATFKTAASRRMLKKNLLLFSMLKSFSLPGTRSV